MVGFLNGENIQPGVLAAILHSSGKNPDGERKPVRNKKSEQTIVLKTLFVPLDPALTKAKPTLANELCEPIRFLCKHL